jgi:hypothetical protein
VSEEKSASAESQRDEEDVVRFAHSTLRENLHLTVNGVLSARFRDPRIREALTKELLAAIDVVVDDHIEAEDLGRGMRPAGEPAQPFGTVDSAMATLKVRLQAALEGGRPGIKQGASAAMKLAPAVASSLREFVHDDVKFGQAQTAATTLLTRYLHPVIARQVVSFAATATRNATPKKEMGNEKGSQSPGPEESA